MSKISTKKLITLSVLVAMDVVLTRFLSLNAWNTRIGFGFVPMVLAALIYGPLSAGIVGALADFIGAILFPTGPYFPGFTFSMFLMGLVFGFFLYKKKAFWRVVVSVLITQFVISLFLTTYWIHMLYGAKYVPLLATRVVHSGIISAA
jgi:ECF transporter S component (folate family)